MVKYGDFAVNQITRILQITDLHLFSSKETKLVGVNTFQSIQRVLAKISDDIKQNHANLIILTGDISQDYSTASYKIAADLLQQFTCPIAITMGNHDHQTFFTEVFGQPSQVISNINNWKILVLNSNRSQHVDGQLSDNELDFLQKSLAASGKLPVLIFLHHHVLPVGSYWLDKIGLSNDKQFLEIIDQYQNIKAVICGHVHQEMLVIRKNVPFYSTPSTSWQFEAKSHNFKLDTLMPGYRWIDLYQDGTFKTGVIRIDYDEKFVPDISSKGY